MNRLKAIFLLAGCLCLFRAYAEDTGSPGTSGGGEMPGQGASAPAQSATPITVQGAYGTAPVTVTPGEGRFAKPPYDFVFTLQQGYDDNIFTSPSHPDPLNPGTPKTASLTTNGSIGFQMQAATPRTVFTLDSSIGALYSWNRPGATTPADYTGSLSFLFFHRINPRTDFTATASLSYQAQPNFSALNAPTRVGGGSYIQGASRLNLSYLWSARLQTNTSYSYNTTLHEKSEAKTGDSYQNTLGNEWRYLYSPRTSLVAEARVMETTNPKNQTADSRSYFLLLGYDYAFTQRLRTTLRAGNQMVSFQSGGASQSSPYVEATLTYIYGHQSTLTWTNRYGLEQTSSVTQKTSSIRSGLNINHVVTARITAVAGINYNRQTTESSTQTVYLDFFGTPVPYTIPGSSVTEQQFNCVLGLQYLVTPKLTLTANYTFTDILSTIKTADYLRSQFSLGASYTF
jgi:opacity protein-like surface antigen